MVYIINTIQNFHFRTKTVFKKVVLLVVTISWTACPRCREAMTGVPRREADVRETWPDVGGLKDTLWT